MSGNSLIENLKVKPQNFPQVPESPCPHVPKSPSPYLPMPSSLITGILVVDRIK
ncbi:MAG: hypothetical protein F6J93_06825 [Oscillatoria sp. SIO1A7]|nr:hypothetical protein [Oscillatoria sp. SIO1A7]